MTLRVATGPVGSEGQKFLAAFVRAVADAHPRVRFKIVSTADLEASAKALADGQVDLAVVRSDMLSNAPGQTIIILRRDVVGFIVPPHSPIKTVRQLAGKALGVVQGPAGNDRLLEQILTHYQVSLQRLQRVVLAPQEIGPAIRQKRIAALFAVGPTGPGPLADAVTAVAKASKGVPDILEIEAAEALAQRFPVLEEADIPPETFGATPPKTDDQDDNLQTVAVTLQLMAHASLPNYVAGEIARLLLTTKAKLASTLPQVGAIEAPDPDKDANLSVHPGADAYFNGEQPSLLEQFEDYVYLVAIIGSMLGAGCAWMMSTWRRALSQDQERLLRLLAILRDVSTADLDTLEALDKEVEGIHAWAVERVAHEAIEPEQFQVFSQVVAEVRQVIDKHRTARR
jgi:TRAP transporter TAXI family solute receptor